MRRTSLLTFCAVLASSGFAQGLIEPGRIAAANELFGSPLDGKRLNCAIESRSPFLDFAFRFELGYIVRCPLRDFDGKPSRMASVLRVTPEGGLPVLFGQNYRIPGMPPDLASTTDIRKVNAEISASGVVALGEGKYTVELVLMDDRERVAHKKWSVRAARKRDEKKVQVMTRPLTATPVSTRPWPARTTPGNGVRLTILLDAAPVDPHSLKLRAWDRTFLLDSVASVLREIPADSVRVVAFNLDQQEEIFREENFDRFALGRLAHSLRKLELGSISYRKLGQSQGWSELLTRLWRNEVEAEQPSDAVIFLGPTTRLSGKLPKGPLTVSKEKRPRFYYLEYFPTWRRGSELPDAIHHFTSRYDGTVLKIHSPGEFASAIDRLRTELHSNETEAEVSRVMKSGD